jgi:hypothetical protein
MSGNGYWGTLGRIVSGASRNIIIYYCALGTVPSPSGSATFLLDPVHNLQVTGQFSAPVCVSNVLPAAPGAVCSAVLTDVGGTVPGGLNAMTVTWSGFPGSTSQGIAITMMALSNLNGVLP